MWRSYLKPLCCFRICKTKFSLDVLPDAMIYQVLCKMQNQQVIRMLKTCSRLNSIGDDYKEKMFNNKELDLQLMFFIEEDKITAKTVDTDKIIENVDFLTGCTVSTILLEFGYKDGKLMDLSKARNYFAELRLKCGRLLLNYCDLFYPVTDFVEWENVSVTIRFYVREEEFQVEFLENLKKEAGDKSHLFEVDIYGSFAYHFVDNPPEVAKSFKRCKFVINLCC